MQLPPQFESGRTVSGDRKFDAVPSEAQGDESPKAREETGSEFRRGGQHVNRPSRCCEQSNLAGGSRDGGRVTAGAELNRKT